MPKDKYTNLAFAEAVEPSAAAIGFSQIQTGVGMFEKTAWLIARVEYFFNLNRMNLMLDESDTMQAGIVVSNKVSQFDQGDPAVVDQVLVGLRKFGTPANALLYQMPIVKNFSDLPGGGILISPSPLFVAVLGSSLAGPTGVHCRIYFTYISLTPSDYWELIEARRIVL